MKTLQRSQLLADVARQRQDQLDELQKRRTAESKTHYAFLAKQEHHRQVSHTALTHTCWPKQLLLQRDTSKLILHLMHELLF